MISKATLAKIAPLITLWLLLCGVALGLAYLDVGLRALSDETLSLVKKINAAAQAQESLVKKNGA